MTESERYMIDACLWEDAALLVVRARGGTWADARKLEAWVGSDPTRSAMITRLEQNWALADEAIGHPALESMRQACSALLQDEQRGLWLRNRTALAACLALVLVIPAYLTRRSAATEAVRVESTHAIPRSFTLADGSVVVLDARSRMEIRYSRAERKVRLQAGQARFAVAHDQRRPFHVVAGERDVQAVGTDFNVDVLPGSLTVSLIAGRVNVARIVEQRPWPWQYWLGSARGPKYMEPVSLAPGQQLVARRRALTMQRFALADVTAWQQGRLALNNRPLFAAAAAVNRYADVKVQIDASVPAQRRVSGSFHARDSAAFASNLVMLYPDLSVERRKNQIVIRARPSQDFSSRSEDPSF